MTVVVALVRGINVGGKNRLPMATLRELAGEIGIERVGTYIQSGNLVGTTDDTDLEALGARLAAAIAERCGFEPAVVLLDRDELERTVADDPFLARGEDTDHLHVLFTSSRVEDLPLDLDLYAPEELAVIDRRVHLFLPNGVGRSKLAIDVARRGPEGTMRNWRTVEALRRLAADLGSG